MGLTKKQRTILDAVIYLIRAGEVPTVREVASLVGLRSASTALKHLRALRDAGLITISGKSRGIRVIDRELLEDLAEDLRTRGASEDAPQPSADGLDQSSLIQLHFSRERTPAAGFAFSSGVRVVGKIAAGRPIDTRAEAYHPSAALADDQPMLSIDPSLFGANADLFAVRVEGDSMVDAGILDGDFVIIRRQDTVEDGEIAAVLIDGQATLKRWYKEGVEARRARERSRRPSGSAALGSGDPSDLRRRYRSDRWDDGDENEDRAVRLEPESERHDPFEIRASDRKEVFIVGKYVGLVRGVQVL